MSSQTSDDSDIVLVDLSDVKMPNEKLAYNHIIVGDSSNIDDGQLDEKEKKVFEHLSPQEMQHYIRFEKNKFTDVLKQFCELQEPSIDTIHIFCDSEIEEFFIENDIIGFARGETCKFIKYGNEIFKFKVEFHDKVAIEKEMNNIMLFIGIDDESGIENIRNEIVRNETANYMIALQNKRKIPGDEVQKRVEYLKIKFEEISKHIGTFMIHTNIIMSKFLNTKYNIDTIKRYFEDIDKLFIILMGE